MNIPFGVAVALFLVSAAVGVFAAVTARRAWLAVFKPLTTLLLLLVVGWPQGRFGWLVVVGIVFSLGGDVALLSPAKAAFLTGLVLFLVAHVSYIAGFVGVAAGLSGGVWSPAVLGAAPLVALALMLLLRRLWSGAAGLRAPLVVYGTALGAMVVAALAAAQGAGGLSALAPAGALLFFVSDASLALDRFARPIKNAPLLTLGLYWLGQLGIALAARLSAA